MKNSQELIMLGLMTKYGFKNNINVMDIGDVADIVLNERRRLFDCALFFRKERNGEFAHVLLCVGKHDQSVFEIYAGRCDKVYLSQYADQVLKQLPVVGSVLEGLQCAFSLERGVGPIYHIPSVNPGERVVKSLHGAVTNFINIVTR